MEKNIKIKSFPALNGESFLITYKNEEVITNILIDTGYVSTAQIIIEECKKLKANNQMLDLVILTHIDNDHINGAREVLGQIYVNKVIEIGQIWYNDYFKLYEINNKNIDSCDEIDINSKKILDKILNSPYHKEKKQFMDQDVGFRSAQYVEQYLLNNEFKDKWNVGFENQCVAIQDRLIKKKISKDVSIVILGPTINILKKQYQEWKEYLIKKGFSTSLLKSQEMARAFEHILMQGDKPEVIVKEKECCNTDDEVSTYLNYEDFDEGITNRTSISVAIEFGNKKVMFLGDSSPIELEKSVSEYIKMIGEETLFELIKVPHHGSKNNWSLNLNKLIRTKRYLIATDGSGGYNHPDLETMIKIISSGEFMKTIFLNYKPCKFIRKISSISEIGKYRYKIVYENEIKNEKKVQEINI